MVNRTTADICFICCTEKATATNSHFTPAALIATAVGKRNYEDSKRIDAGSEKPFDSYYGRANLSNTDTEIKQHHHAANYIFCPDCEKKLGVLEGIISPILIEKLKDPNQSANFPIIDFKTVKVITCNKVDSKLLFLYFYSVIWRQVLQQQLEKEQNQVLTNEQMEVLRKIISASLCSSPEEYKEISFDIIPLFVVSAENFEDSSSNLIMPHSKFVNPYCFMANEFIISIEFPYPKNCPVFFNLNSSVFIKELMNHDVMEPFKIGVVTYDKWMLFLKNTATYEADKFINKYVSLLSIKTGMGKLRCRLLLCVCAKKKNKTSGRLFGEDFIDCYEQFLSRKYIK